MELFSSEFFAALAAIIVIDLVLAGDNAIVIALAARGLPAAAQAGDLVGHRRRNRGARRHDDDRRLAAENPRPDVLRRTDARLDRVPPARSEKRADQDHDVKGATGFWGAMSTIVVADAMMGLDNVLAVAGAAHGSYVLVVTGLLISIPIVVWGSQLVLKLVERYPAIIYVGRRRAGAHCGQDDRGRAAAPGSHSRVSGSRARE